MIVSYRDKRTGDFATGKRVNVAAVARPLEQRRTSGGKGTEYRLPKCGNVFSNHNYFPRRCKCRIGPARQSRQEVLARQKIQRVGRRVRHYIAQITRVASSAIARSCESGIPCLSSAGPPLLQRSTTSFFPPRASPSARRRSRRRMTGGAGTGQRRTSASRRYSSAASVLQPPSAPRIPIRTPGDRGDGRRTAGAGTGGEQGGAKGLVANQSPADYERLEA